MSARIIGLGLLFFGSSLLLTARYFKAGISSIIAFAVGILFTLLGCFWLYSEICAMCFRKQIACSGIRVTGKVVDRSFLDEHRMCIYYEYADTMGHLYRGRAIVTVENKDTEWRVGSECVVVYNSAKPTFSVLDIGP
jgi:hypothetical protein